MARPKTGRTPDSVRQINSLAALRKSGGDKVCVNLQASAIADLSAIMSARGYRDRKAAVSEALALLARSIKDTS